MENRQISELMETSMQKIKEMIGANAIVGDPITTGDGTTLVPVSKVSFGFAGGGTEFGKKEPKPSPGSFGGGTGAGVHITPICFIVTKKDSVDILYISPPARTPLDSIIEKVPGVIDRFTEMFDKNKADEEAE